MRILLLIILLSPLSTMADKQLRATVCQSCDYALRWNPTGDSLQLSGQEAWDPWMPEAAFGWQILDEGQLRGMFFCPNDFIRDINFEEQIVLAIVRYDSVKWNFFPRSVRFSEDDPLLRIEYEAITRTLRPKSLHLSTAIILIDINEQLRKTGISNLLFELQETQRGPWPEGESPYPPPTADVLFPVAYSPAQLKRSFLYRAQLLHRLLPPAPPITWHPDVVQLNHLIPRKGVATSTGTTYFIIEDSLDFTRCFQPMTGRSSEETLVFTQADFDRCVILAIVRAEPGYHIALENSYWAEEGFQLKVSVRPAPNNQNPEAMLLLFPKGDYGELGIWENGVHINSGTLW